MNLKGNKTIFKQIKDIFMFIYLNFLRLFDSKHRGHADPDSLHLFQVVSSLQTGFTSYGLVRVKVYAVRYT